MASVFLLAGIALFIGIPLVSGFLLLMAIGQAVNEMARIEGDGDA